MDNLSLLITQPHACSYLPQRTARNLVVDPRLQLDGSRYELLLSEGFRRSGDAVYRPHCPECTACTPVRVPVARFEPNRSQRRCMQINRDLTLVRRTQLDDDAMLLYERYLKARHPEGGMDAEDREGFSRFTQCRWLTVEYWHLLLEDRLLACAVVDVLPHSYSAVYTVFDPAPEHRRRGLGTYSVLLQIAAAREEGRRHVWLGYWIPGCEKMTYKQQFLPQERAYRGRWATIAPES